MKNIKNILLTAMIGAAAVSCTNLDENVYDKVVTENYYNTRMDVIRAAFRPFEHAYWSIQSRTLINELSADQIITPVRDGWWDDGGRWRRIHYHQWRNDESKINAEWTGCFQGIGQCNLVIEDLNRLNPADFGFEDEEYNNIKTQCRVLRAWFYHRLLDAFRNVPLAVSFYNQDQNIASQVDPKQLFDFIEKELKESIPLLIKKQNLGGPLETQGQFNQAAAAAILVRLYLNAPIYIGEDRTDDCMLYAQRILDGEYGTYAISDRWDAAFDWDNETCDEIIFGFPGSSAYSYWHYQGDTYWWSVPSQAKYYFNDSRAKPGDHNCRYAAAPSLDPTGTPYTTTLGRPVAKFKNYPEDERLKLYTNLGNSRREGLFLFGRLPNNLPGAGVDCVRDPNDQYDLYIRDAVGQFRALPADQWLASPESDLTKGDHNSGWHFVKYPIYSDDDPHQLDSDYAEIRLSEIIYSLAECKLRSGDAAAAGRLLNSVRKRNYPSDSWSRNLYMPEGAAVLDQQEMLDEWGREFFAEGRRRVDLIRYGVFNSGTWYDKEADGDDHTMIFDIPKQALNTNSLLKHNPGYN